MNLPNKLTMMRVIMVPFFMVFAAMSHMGTPRFNATYALIAGILFAVASFTDFLPCAALVPLLVLALLWHFAVREEEV